MKKMQTPGATISKSVPGFGKGDRITGVVPAAAVAASLAALERSCFLKARRIKTP